MRQVTGEMSNANAHTRSHPTHQMQPNTSLIQTGYNVSVDKNRNTPEIRACRAAQTQLNSTATSARNLSSSRAYLCEHPNFCLVYTWVRQFEHLQQYGLSVSAHFIIAVHKRYLQRCDKGKETRQRRLSLKSCRFILSPTLAIQACVCVRRRCVEIFENTTNTDKRGVKRFRLRQTVTSAVHLSVSGSIILWNGRFFVVSFSL